MEIQLTTAILYVPSKTLSNEFVDFALLLHNSVTSPVKEQYTVKLQSWPEL